MKELLDEVTEKNVDYAILSHTWIRNSPGDITFQDWTTREQNSQGNAKIIKFCNVAAMNHGVTLGWIDSVCINKESSSELMNPFGQCTTGIKEHLSALHIFQKLPVSLMHMVTPGLPVAGPCRSCWHLLIVFFTIKIGNLWAPVTMLKSSQLSKQQVGLLLKSWS